jgi:hypothetical protein
MTMARLSKLILIYQVAIPLDKNAVYSLKNELVATENTRTYDNLCTV